jgi:hypothetical protein
VRCALLLGVRSERLASVSTEQPEEFGLAGGDRQRGVSRGVDLCGSPLPFEDAGGGSSLHAALDLLGAKLPRVEQEDRVNPPGPGRAP